MNRIICKGTKDFRVCLYLATGMLPLLTTCGCEDRVKIRQGDVEISFPRKEYEASRALNEKFWRLRPQDLDKTLNPVKLPDIKY